MHYKNENELPNTKLIYEISFIKQYAVRKNQSENFA